MGFMDKVKAQATVLAEKAQEGAKAGQAKISEMQAKKHADALLLELGGLTYAEQAGRAPAGASERVSTLVEELRQHEAEHGPVTVTTAPAATTAPRPTVTPDRTIAPYPIQLSPSSIRRVCAPGPEYSGRPAQGASRMVNPTARISWS